MTDYTGGGTRVELWAARNGPADGGWRFYRGRGSITAEQLDRSFELLRMLLDLPTAPSALLRAEMLFRATSSLVERDWSGALVNAWTASEGLLGDRLARYLQENEHREIGLDALGNKHDFIEKNRSKWLKGSDMTVRHTMELLSLLGLLPFELYLHLRECPTARNRWIHGEAEPSAESAHLTVSSLGELFELVEGVPLRVLRDESA